MFLSPFRIGRFVCVPLRCFISLLFTLGRIREVETTGVEEKPDISIDIGRCSAGPKAIPSELYCERALDGTTRTMKIRSLNCLFAVSFLVLLLYRILKNLVFFETMVCSDMYSEFEAIRYRARGRGWLPDWSLPHHVWYDFQIVLMFLLFVCSSEGES